MLSELEKPSSQTNVVASQFSLVTEQDKQTLRKYHEQKHGIKLPIEASKIGATIRDRSMQKYNNLIDGTVVTSDGLSLTTKQNMVSGHRRLKERITFINISSAHRQKLIEELVMPNADGLYLREVVDDQGIIRIENYTADILNNEHVPSPGEPVRPYFVKSDGKIYKLKPLYKDPHQYEYELPRIFTNVKSVRLISSEIPNTISNINLHNDLITIEVIDEDVTPTEEELTAGVTRRIPLKPSVREPFFTIRLEHGNYSLVELIDHLNQKINKTINLQAIEKFDELITIDYIPTTGEINFQLNNPPGRNLSFHLRFNSPSATPVLRTLWHMLGFNTAYDINVDGTSSFVTSRKNTVLHLPQSADKHYRVNRVPCVYPSKYVYMAIDQLGTFIDSAVKQSGLFARFTMDETKRVSIDKFSSTAKIFMVTPLAHLDKLKIDWLDSTGAHVDFQGRDHSFVLEIIEYVDLVDINNFSSRRGVSDMTSYSKGIYR